VRLPGGDFIWSESSEHLVKKLDWSTLQVRAMLWLPADTLVTMLGEIPVALPLCAPCRELVCTSIV
jgi:hypothetical protein